MGVPDYTDTICDRLATVQPEIRNEPQAYKRAVIRMALAEYEMFQSEQVMGMLGKCDRITVLSE